MLDRMAARRMPAAVMTADADVAPVRARNEKGEIMGSVSSPKTPADPDPTPMSSSDTSQEVQGAARAEKKRVAKSYGRQKTILAGNTAQDNASKKTILGG